MSLPVTLRPEAASDLRSARDWYEQQRAGLGVLFAIRAAAAIDELSIMAEAYAVIWQDIRARLVARHPYVIYYRVLTDRIEVVAVLHGSRDPSVWQRRVSP